ncbi:MAG TPA: hypothetical protein EYG79_12765 [Rhodobacteraceae bacterium]|nr:hypothetical protein [Paracoccaceae bacterium]
MSQANPLPDTAYWRAYQGRAAGLIDWKEVDALWPQLGVQPEGWYVYDLETAPPVAPMPAPDFTAFLPQAEALVNARRDRSHSGAIYIDSREAPAFIKIFDPKNMGTSCGGDHEMIFPRYILSKTKPDPRPAPAPKAKGFFGRLILKR